MNDETAPTEPPSSSPSSATPQDIEFEAGSVLRIVGSGFAMGSADVVPGVSGGTMAVACGIYQQLLAAIASIDKTSVLSLLKLQWGVALSIIHWRFLVALAAGILSAIVIMVKVVGLPHLLQTHPTLVYAVFFGLVLASVVVLGRGLRWTSARVASLLIGTLFGWVVVTLVPVDMPSTPLHMFAYGTVAISAMLLPGISGSFILLILGQYERVIGAIEALIHFDLSALMIVVPFGLGCLVGIASFSRLVAWLLARYHDTVVAGLCGLLVGSLWRIWPFQQTVTAEVRGKLKVVEATPYFPDTFPTTALLLTVGGFVLVLVIESLARRRTSSGESHPATEG